MATAFYDEDRLPWLDDTPRPLADTANSFGAFVRGVGTGAAAGALGIAAVAAFLFALLAPSPGDDPVGPSVTVRLEEKAAIAPAIADACVQKCAESVTASPAVPDGDARLPAAQDSVELQLGAYRSRAAAHRGWDYLSGRFPWLRRYSQTVARGSGDEAGFVRLRLLVPTETEAQKLCRSIRQGGEECFLVRQAEG